MRLFWFLYEFDRHRRPFAIAAPVSGDPGTGDVIKEAIRWREK